MSEKGESKRKTRLWVVLSLPGLLIAICLCSMVGIQVPIEPTNAKTRVAKVQMQQFEIALNTYFLDNGFLPTTEQGLQALVEKPKIEPIPTNYNPNAYIDKVPLDPWGHPYDYAYRDGKIVITCYGFDGKPGGKGKDADITNLDLHE